MAFSGTGGTSKSHRTRGAEQKIREKLARWFRRAGRDLPWRRTADPYAILVSEFMLQQTTVAVVEPYFARWMEAFPTPAALAAADEREVLSLWQGLGYYSRARNLRRAAQAVVERHGGRVPAAVDALRSLPGVGEYTAGAVAAFAFDQAVPVVDANIARVLARLNNWTQAIDDAAGREFLRGAARALLPATGGRLHTSALMELGALVCSPRRPRCLACPVAAACRATDPAPIPVKRPRAAVTELVEHRAFFHENEAVWLAASPGPRWRGLWLLPACHDPGRPPDHEVVHPITRFRVRLNVHRAAAPAPGWERFPLAALPPMPAPHRRAVAALLKTIHTPRHAR